MCLVELEVFLAAVGGSQSNSVEGGSISSYEDPRKGMGRACKRISSWSAHPVNVGWEGSPESGLSSAASPLFSTQSKREGLDFNSGLS